MEEIYWECFFNNAGINGVTSKEYAAIFVKNKISDIILPHLNESYLKSMGIDAIGDIIRILKYSKDFLEEKKVTPKTVKETKERHVEILQNKNQLNEDKSVNKKITITSTYTKPPGCELPVAVKRIVTPEIEGRYKIKYPSKSPITSEKQQSQKTEQLKPVTKPIATSNRIVILNDTSHFGINSKVSVMKRLGKSSEQCTILLSSDEDDDTDIIKKQKLDIKDNDTLSKRFVNVILSRETKSKVHESKVHESKDKINNKTNERSVFARLGNSPKRDTESGSGHKLSSHISEFKAPSVEKKVKIRSGHTTDGYQKMEATSTTEFGSLRSDSIVTKEQSRHVLNRLGRKM